MASKISSRGWAGGIPAPILSQAVTSPLRCGRLAFHIQLPFSFLHFPYVEAAIRSSHIKDFCGNCSLYPNTTQEVRAGMLAGAGIPAVLGSAHQQEQSYLRVGNGLCVGSCPQMCLRGKVMEGLE